jgi:hypothetical protein
MQNVFRTLVWLAAATLGYAAGGPEKPPLAHDMMGVANGCFVESIAFLDHWQETFGADSWAQMVQWGAKADEEVVAGHAVAVGEARGRIWCWDINFGWKALPVDPAQRENIDVISAPILARYPKVTARFPVFRHDFAQSPGNVSPAQPGADNPSIRDASIVGERLARHRPVSVVRYQRPGGDEGAAVIFVFHGRYCIYVPEIGTVPFVRIHGGVENLRQTLQALQRLVPGAAAVKKL